MHDTITNADTLKIVISFTPDTARPYSDTLYIMSNASNPLTEVPLSGNGSITAVSQNNSSMPNNYGISQNYPNPFNPTTVINYQLPVNSFVTLKIYDVIGSRSCNFGSVGIKIQDTTMSHSMLRI